VVAVLLFLILKNKPEEPELYKMIDYKTSDFSLQEVKIPRIEQKNAAQKSQSKPITDAPLVVKDDEKEVKKGVKPEGKEETDGKGKSEIKLEEKGKDEATENLKTVSSDTTGTHLYSDELFMKVEISAEFPGGPISFGKFLGENIQYPEYAKKNKVDGIVYVHFIVGNDGTISDLKIYKGIEESCNNEVLRVMKLSPKWIPARQKAKFVRQRMIVPVRFRTQ